MNSRASELIAALKRIAVAYQAALDVLRGYQQQKHHVTHDRMRICADTCSKLQPSLKLIAECEEQLAPLRRSFQSHDACQESDEALAHSETLLKELLQHIDTLQHDLKAERDSLGTGIDRQRQHSVVHQAYASH